jgi:hypothetical protein
MKKYTIFKKNESGFEAINDCFCKVSTVDFIDFDYCTKANDCLDLMLQELYNQCFTVSLNNEKE